MKIMDFSPARAEAVTRYESVGATSVALGDGDGEAHAYCVRIEPGGRIGAHPTGFAQLFVCVEGGDGVRRELAAGQAAWFARGEQHAKGSDHGMTAVMIQVEALEPRDAAAREAE